MFSGASNCWVALLAYDDCSIMIRNGGSSVGFCCASAPFFFYPQGLHSLISTGASARIDLPELHPVIPENLATQQLIRQIAFGLWLRSSCLDFRFNP